MVVRIIDIVSNENTRKWWESFHIHQFKTLFPFGLNTQVFDKTVSISSIINNNNPLINDSTSLNNQTKVKRHRRGGRRNKCSLDFTKTTLTNLVNKLKQFQLIKTNWIKNFVYSIRIKLIKHMWHYCQDVIQTNTDLSTTVYAIVLEHLKVRAIQYNIDLKYNDNQITYSKEFCIFNFYNKSFNYIPFANIFRNIKKSFPLNNINISAAFKYETPLGRSIFNYNEISRNLNCNSPLQCCCKPDSIGFDNNHNHIVTGNLDIVKNSTLKKFMKLGTNFKIEKNRNIKTSITTNLDCFIYKMAVKYSLPLCSFDEWKDKFILHFLSYYPHQYTGQHLNMRLLKCAINDLQNNYVISYLDKVASNYAFTCKKYYYDLLIQSYNDINLYKPLNVSEREIKNRITALYKKTGLTIKNFKFPYLALIPKLHKNPIKFRPVTIACNTYLTLANDKLLKILNKLIDKFRIDGCFFVKNSYNVVKLISNSTVKKVVSFDFADLFNTIDIHILFQVLLNYFEQYDLQEFITFPKFKALLTIVLNENILYNGIGYYQQIYGIPMGGGCSSALADIYLHHYEFGTHVLNEILYIRYVDDILIGYEQEEFKLNFNFYPNNLNLIETEPNNDYSVDFLDLNICINNETIVIKIYDKRDAFKFKINRISPWSSCLHKNIFRNIIINQLIRCSRIFTYSYDSDSFVVNFIQIAIDNNYPLYFLLNILKQYYQLDYITCKSRFLNRLSIRF